MCPAMCSNQQGVVSGLGREDPRRRDPTGSEPMIEAARGAVQPAGPIRAAMNLDLQRQLGPSQ